jgi:TctA family transporter
VIWIKAGCIDLGSSAAHVAGPYHAAIAFGIPSSAADMATVIDGYPLAKMGRAGEALGASLSASAIGGVIGAIAFLVAIPIARPWLSASDRRSSAGRQRAGGRPKYGWNYAAVSPAR